MRPQLAVPNRSRTDLGRHPIDRSIQYVQRSITLRLAHLNARKQEDAQFPTTDAEAKKAASNTYDKGNPALDTSYKQTQCFINSLTTLKVPCKCTSSNVLRQLIMISPIGHIVWSLLRTSRGHHWTIHRFSNPMKYHFSLDYPIRRLHMYPASGKEASQKSRLLIGLCVTLPLNATEFHVLSTMSRDCDDVLSLIRSLGLFRRKNCISRIKSLLAVEASLRLSAMSHISFRQMCWFGISEHHCNHAMAMCLA
ncbi:hypothetical protein F5B20DRAFT_31768 [Whalleya microplaca]|nr:hypothetical protein F5B20DRAFT_31768 [Whalleya microplaca]